MLIKIGNKKYVGYCNAMTYIYYNKVFNANIFDDLDRIKEYLIKINLQKIEKNDVDNMVNIILKLVYILIYTNNPKKINRFEKWKNEHKNEIIEPNTTNEIIEYLIDNFYSKDVKEELEKIKTTKKQEEDIIFQEHTFLKQCLELGLSCKDLEELSYVDVCKTLIINMNKINNAKKAKYKEATTQDWDMLAIS